MAEKAVKVVNEMEKIIRNKKLLYLWLSCQQGKISKKFKTNNKFINLVKEFDISRWTMAFKISIVNFLNKYPKMKKSSLSHCFLKNNFRIIKEICYENVSKFKQQFYANF